MRHSSRLPALLLAATMTLAACAPGDSTPAPPDRPFSGKLHALLAPLATQRSAVVTRDGFALQPTPHLRAELGTNAAAPLRIIASPGGTVTVHRRGALSTAGHLDGGAVVYEGAQPDADALVYATRGGVEELVVARAPGVSIAYDLELPASYQLHRSAVPGLVEICDAAATARLRLWVKRAWDANGRDVPVEPIVEGPGRVRVALDEAQVGAWPVVIDPEWTLATDMTIPRTRHTATLLPDGRVLIAGGDAPALGLTELFDPRTGTFTSAAPMTHRRTSHTATLLPTGKVLLTGGTGSWSKRLEPLIIEDVTDTTEVFDPRMGTFTPGGPLQHPRSHHTATLLPDGKVLLAGGFDGTKEPTADAEVYDGNTLTKGVSTISLSATRANHAATLVDSGLVVLSGGGSYSQKVPLPNADHTIEIVDPGKLSSVWNGGLLPGSQGLTALLLPSGKVYLDSLGLPGGLLFDPASALGQGGDLFTSAQCPQTAWSSLVLLPSGRVLAMGGKADTDNEVGPTTDAVTLVDPAHLACRALPPMTTARELATATLLPSGLVLIAGGYNRTTDEVLASAETHDPGEARLEATGSMLEQREQHTMNLLASGQVLIAGGDQHGGLAGAEVYDPTTETFHAVGPMQKKRAWHTATTLPPPPGGAPSQILIAAGHDLTGDGLNQVERYDPATEWFFADKALIWRRQHHGAALLADDTILFMGDEPNAERRSPDGSGQSAGDEMISRHGATTSVLDDGRVLFLGGETPNGGPVLDTASLFDGQGQVASIPIGPPRSGHTATTLDDGSVLIMGGYSMAIGGMMPRDDVLRFYPAQGEQGSFVSQPALLAPREGHTATMLDDGHTLLVAGSGHGAELYDVGTGMSKKLSSKLPEEIRNQAALRLLDGRVLLTGGDKSDGPSMSAVLYEPNKQAFQIPTEGARSWHTATLLRSGNILLAGGLPSDQGEGLGTADLFDPRKRTFTPTGAMKEPRLAHTATLVADGRVLLAGGLSAMILGLSLPASSTYETWNGTTFQPGGELQQARAYHTATPLADGRVLLTGGLDGSELLASTEILDPSTGESRPAGTMNHARYRHAAVRLPSGRVLIAGGVTLDNVHPYDGKPIASAEIYDPVADTFKDITTGSAPIPGDARATVLPSGEVLIVGDQIAYRFDESSGLLSAAGSAPSHPFGVTVFPGGRLLVCGLSRCDTGPASGPAFASVLDSAGRSGDSFTLLPDGELFALGLTPYHARHTFSYRAFPPDVPRPVITDVPGIMTAGEPVEIGGSRFQRMSARGTPEARPALPHIVPLISFVPATGGAPVNAVPGAWTDSTITFTAPPTPYHGGGWLVVVVDGVPSAGVWIELAPAGQGSACTLDGDCASGHCAEGVCCDQACSTGCLSCRKSDKSAAEDGTCRPIGYDEVPRFGCEPNDSVCTSTGRCDGTGDCIYPSAGQSCGEVPNGLCLKGTCVTGCKSNVDCSTGLICLPTGACVTPPDPGQESSGCSAAPGRGGSAGLDALVILMILRLARRRRAQKT